MQTTNEVKADQYRQVSENTFIKILIPEYVPTANDERKVLEEAPLDDSNLVKLCSSFLVDRGVIPLETKAAIFLRPVKDSVINCVKEVHFILNTAFFETCISNKNFNSIHSSFYPEPYKFTAVEFKSIPRVEGEIDEDYLADEIDLAIADFIEARVFIPYDEDGNFDYMLTRGDEMKLMCHKKHHIFHSLSS
ncbi:MAG: hypothetical protein ACYDEJ_04535 [Desulfitobacteriaceae bacterium]